MRCTVCDENLASDHYALVYGAYFCFKCFLRQYGSDSGGEKRSDSSSSRSNRPRSSSSKPFTNFFRKKSSTERDLPKSSNDQKQICQVCFDEKSSKDFQRFQNHNCHQQSSRTICDQCIYEHVRKSFEEMCTDEVRCPELNCNEKFNYETIKLILKDKDKKLFQRYERFLNLHQVEQMSEFIWCSNPKCQMGQLNEGANRNNIVTCIRCRQKTCFKHKIAWHVGLTCEQYDAQTNQDVKETLKWLNQNTKACPKCEWHIEKNDGCDHMTCLKCRYEFCWACLADYDRIRRDGNHRHDSSCKHYAAYEKK